MPRKRGSAAAGISDFQGIGGRIAEGGADINLKPEELVKALRCCAEGECKDCAMHEDKQRCQENLLDKSAGAIERDQKEIAKLKAKVEQYRVLIPSWVIPMTPKED